MSLVDKLPEDQSGKDGKWVRIDMREQGSMTLIKIAMRWFKGLQLI